MSCNCGEEDPDHLSKSQDQNGEKYEDAAEEVEDSGKRKGKQAKGNIQTKQRKRKIEETEKDGNNKKDWNDSNLTSIDKMVSIEWHLQTT